MIWRRQRSASGDLAKMIGFASIASLESYESPCIIPLR